MMSHDNAGTCRGDTSGNRGSVLGLTWTCTKGAFPILECSHSRSALQRPTSGHWRKQHFQDLGTWRGQDGESGKKRKEKKRNKKGLLPCSRHGCGSEFHWVLVMSQACYSIRLVIISFNIVDTNVIVWGYSQFVFVLLVHKWSWKFVYRCCGSVRLFCHVSPVLLMFKW